MQVERLHTNHSWSAKCDCLCASSSLYTRAKHTVSTCKGCETYVGLLATASLAARITDLPFLAFLTPAWKQCLPTLWLHFLKSFARLPRSTAGKRLEPKFLSSICILHFTGPTTPDDFNVQHDQENSQEKLFWLYHTAWKTRRIRLDLLSYLDHRRAVLETLLSYRSLNSKV